MAHATLEVVGNVGVITLNTPDNYNALGPQMSADLLQAIYDAVDDDAVRALLITGAGKGFCSGAQMGEEIFASGGDIGEIMRTTITPLITRLRTSDKPVVTAINGPAAGAGVGLALAGDIVIAGPGLEDVAQQVQLRCLACMHAQEIKKGLRSAWHRRLQMQVGNKKRSRFRLRLLVRSRGWCSHIVLRVEGRAEATIR